MKKLYVSAQYERPDVLLEKDDICNGTYVRTYEIEIDIQIDRYRYIYIQREREREK